MKLIDMHCDTVSELYYKKERGESCSLYENDLQVDCVKLRAGGYMLQNFAVFANLRKRKAPFAYANALIDLYYEQLEANKRYIRPVYTFADIEKNEGDGVLSAMLTAEEGEICEGSIEKLRALHGRGMRMMTLTWNYANSLSTPNGIKIETGENIPEYKYGLTPKGFEFISEMERLGVIIDVSHLSDAGVWDVLRNTKKPFVASHSNARAVCCHTRNLTDEMLRAMGERGCVAGVNYCCPFVESITRPEDYGCSFEQVVRHIKHMINKGGVGCVGFGSDFDGIDRINLEMRDAAYMHPVEDEMKRRGMTSEEIDAVTHKNVLRLYKETI